MLLTCRELAKTLGVDYLQASSIIKVIIKSGVGSVSDSIKSGCRGRPTVTYDIPRKIFIDLGTGEVTKGGDDA